MKHNNTAYQIPVNLHPKARQNMKRLLAHLEENKKIKSIDFAELDLIAYTYDDMIESIEIIRKEGRVVKEITARGNRVTKSHPAVKIKADCMLRLIRLYSDFGLNPKSRGEIDAKQGNLFDDLSPALQKFRS